MKFKNLHLRLQVNLVHNLMENWLDQMFKIKIKNINKVTNFKNSEITKKI